MSHNTQHHDGHLDAETLESFLDGEVGTESSTEGIERHLSTCPRCHRRARGLALARTLPLLAKRAERAPCPTRESLEEYARDDGLDEEAREALTEHLIDCEECCERALEIAVQAAVARVSWWERIARLHFRTTEVLRLALTPPVPRVQWATADRGAREKAAPAPVSLSLPESIGELTIAAEPTGLRVRLESELPPEELGLPLLEILDQAGAIAESAGLEVGTDARLAVAEGAATLVVSVADIRCEIPLEIG
jgi:hypothetical protein